LETQLPVQNDAPVKILPPKSQHEDGLKYGQGRGSLEFPNAGAVQKGSDRKVVKERSYCTLQKAYFLLYLKLAGSIHLCSSLLILLAFSQKSIYQEAKSISR
jgi:hypothetical protein